MSEERKEFLRLQIREIEHNIRRLERDLRVEKMLLLAAKNELSLLFYPVEFWVDESARLREAEDAETV